MKVKRALNGFLGFEPVSTIVELMPGLKYLTTLEANYRMIKGEDTKDIIFQGVIAQNLEFLKWACCRLMAEGHYLSMIVDTQELEKIQPEDVVVHRLILVVCGDTPIGKFCKSCEERLTENDIILLKTHDPKDITFLQTKMRELECEAHLYIDMSMIDKKKFMTYGFNTVYPYYGEI